MKRRIAAEWEPVIGVMVSWPLHLPLSIIKDFSTEEHVFFLVENKDAENDAKSFMKRAGLNLENISYISVPKGFDGSWPRDWGPHPVFLEDGELVLGCAKYLNSTPNSGVGANDTLMNPYNDLFEDAMDSHGVEDVESIGGSPLDGTVISPKENCVSKAIAEQLGFHYIEMPITLTGGNIMSDGRGTMLSCAILTNENRFNGISDEMFFSYTSKELGADTYSILSNYEDMGIQHIDCLLKMVDEETLIVARPPKDHELYKRYEDIVNNEIAQLRTCYGRPYRVFRIDTVRFNDEDLTAYANSYILNKKVYVPLYGVKQDEMALQQWQKAMPGYEIRGFEYCYDDCSEEEKLGIYDTYTGWASFDVIHCRTKSIWDKEMLYMSVRRLDETVKASESYPVDVHIIDYSKTGLVKSELKLFWRVQGSADWNELALIKTPTNEVYRACIPNAPQGTTIEYYTAAKDNSGRSETMPRVAPKATYQFTIL